MAVQRILWLKMTFNNISTCWSRWGTAGKTNLSFRSGHFW